jgi:cytosine/adenosine deaminase-related metal-dependent hydrolase
MPEVGGQGVTTTLIRNAPWLVALDRESGQHHYRRNVDILFDEQGIREIGRIDGSADTVIDGSDFMVLPGFVNIHSHPSMQAIGKGIVEELGNPKLFGSGLYDSKAPFRLHPDGYPASQQVALCELLLSGVTTVLDIPMRPYPGYVEILGRSGMRVCAAPMFASARWYSENGHHVEYAWDVAEGERQFRAAMETIEEAEKHESGRLSGMVYPAQIDTCTPELIRDSHRIARETGRLWQIHAAQSAVEFYEMTRRHGVTPVRWLHDLGVLGPGSSVGHGLFIDTHSWVKWPTRDDLTILKETGTSVAHCPTPFARYGHVMESLGDYLAAGINVGLGTDCHPHDFVMEMAWAAILGRVAAGRLERLTTGQVFDAATLGGARALNRTDIGGLAPGMQSDIVLIDIRDPAMRPVRDPLRSMLYSAGSRVVRHVFIGGRQVVRDREVLTMDLESALIEVEKWQRRALEEAPARSYVKLPADRLSPLSLPVAGEA